jgi:dihydroorotase
MSYELTIPLFMDMHCHLREGAQLDYTTYSSALWCDTIVAMPNLKDPLTDISKVCKYHTDILEYSYQAPPNIIIPLYLTPETTPKDILQAWEGGVICAKAYPRGRTSHSQQGLHDFLGLEDVYRAMGECGMRLLIHPEHPAYDSWEAEEMFFKQVWPFFRGLISEGVKLKISLEHLSTRRGVHAVVEAGGYNGSVVGTITPHHMLAYIGDLVDGLDSVYYCKPVVKQREDQQVLRGAATSGSELFLLGSDSAPWKEEDKNKRLPCAGCWTAPWLPQLLAHIFSEEAALNRLQTFTHDNAVKWWGLEPAKESLRIISRKFTIPEKSFDCYPFLGGKTLSWDAERVLP